MVTPHMQTTYPGTLLKRLWFLHIERFICFDSPRDTNALPGRRAPHISTALGSGFDTPYLQEVLMFRDK